MVADQTVSRGLKRGSRAGGGKFAGINRDRKLIGIKGTAYLHERLRAACNADGLTSAELISSLLDLRDRDIKRRVGSGNPLET